MGTRSGASSCVGMYRTSFGCWPGIPPVTVRIGMKSWRTSPGLRVQSVTSAPSVWGVTSIQPLEVISTACSKVRPPDAKGIGA